VEERRKAFGYLARRGHGTPGGGEEARGGGARVGATQSGRRMGWGRVGGDPSPLYFASTTSSLASPVARRKEEVGRVEGRRRGLE
jgi:hypothetical protein